MKVRLNAGNSQTVMTLIPETDEDKRALKAFADQTSRVNIINCRGFEYLAANVEFLVQPMPSRD